MAHNEFAKLTFRQYHLFHEFTKINYGTYMAVPSSAFARNIIDMSVIKFSFQFRQIKFKVKEGMLSQECKCWSFRITLRQVILH